MQLWCIVKQVKQKNSLNQATSILLVALIIFLFAAPTLHAHHNEAPLKHREKPVVSTSYKCLTCSFLSHQQHQKYLISLGYPSVAAVRIFIPFLSRAIARVHEFSQQGFTNKGPPFIS
jgi:hypothetical protein